MKWADLSPTQRRLAVAGAIVLVTALVIGAYALGRSGDEEPVPAEEPTQTLEPTQTAEPTSSAAPQTPEPQTQAQRQPTPAPAPAPQADRVFGLLKGIRDESGGMWSDLWIDIDTAEFLTGDAALAWLTAQGDEAFYNADYWYAKNESAAITSYRLVSPGPPVWMYTYPVRPAPGFYGPGMSKQVVEFGTFYDRIYMYGDADGLLNRYYWFTLDGDEVTLIEEQPRDPFYEP